MKPNTNTRFPRDFGSNAIAFTHTFTNKPAALPLPFHATKYCRFAHIFLQKLLGSPKPLRAYDLHQS